ncbi:MAG: prealbumin-like fold domain-containing protein, partial [Clostridiales Family XIII bacterium]|nr:prealbumin-like fold domain-containing protein [Clostridiales Family XIII bacterium]
MKRLNRRIAILLAFVIIFTTGSASLVTANEHSVGLQTGTNTLHTQLMSGGTTTDDKTGMLTGQEAEMRFVYTKNSANAAVLAIPVPDPSKGDYRVTLPSAYTVDDSHIGAAAEPLPAEFGSLAGKRNYLLIWSKEQASIITVKFRYSNGVTPDDTSLTVNAKLFEATGSAGSYSAIKGSGVDSTDSTGATADPVTLVWNTNENITISKSVTSSVKPVFTDLQDRSYSSVAANNDSTYTATYRLAVKTTGRDNSGRIFMDKMTITDKLSGYLNGANQKPVSIVVKDATDGNVIASSTPTGNQTPVKIGDDTTFSFDIPNVANAAKIDASYEFDVTVKWDKNAYTKYYDSNAPDSVFTGKTAVAVRNTASLTYKPVTSSDPVQVSPAAADISLGWRQLPPAGRISIHVYTLRRYHSLTISSDGQDWEVAAAAQFALKDADDKVIATGVSDENGSITFDDIPSGVDYRLVEITGPGGSASGSEYILQEGDLEDGNVSQLTNITSDTDSVTSYTVRYKRNEGSLLTGKAFLNAAGAMMPNTAIGGSYSAVFHLVYDGGSNDGKDVPNSSFTISGLSQIADIIEKPFPDGKYIIVEDSLTLGAHTYTPASQDSP